MQEIALFGPVSDTIRAGNAGHTLKTVSLPDPEFPYPAAHYSLTKEQRYGSPSSAWVARPPRYRIESNLGHLPHLICRWAWPAVISLLPDAMELEDVTSPSGPLGSTE